MKSVSESVFDQITDDHTNEVGAVLHAEWPMNRFYNTVVDNTPSEEDAGFDIEYFPIESIAGSNRPTSGICKATVGRAFVERKIHDEVPPARFYTVDAEDEYQYWQSPKPTNANGVFPIFNATNFPLAESGFDNLTSVRPEVVYHTEQDDEGNSEPISIEVNKIVFTIENTFTYPTEYDVQVKTLGGAWTTVASDLEVPENGKVELWYDGTNWTENQNLDFTAELSGVRLVVHKMYVPTPVRSVSVSTTAGLNLITASGGSLTAADIGATITGSGIPAGATIRTVTNRKVVTRRWRLKDGSTVSANRRPANAKMELNPITTYYTDANLSVPATATGSSTTASVTVTPVGVYFNLIELGLRLERDLTNDLSGWSSAMTMGEADFITPLGDISSNTASVILWNGDEGTYRNNNENTPYHGILDKGVIFRCWTKYGDEKVREFEMLSDNWSEGDDSTSVSLVDSSVIFMEAKPRAVMYQKMPVQEIVWRICDIIGYTNYEITTIDEASTIDIFWTDGQKTAWEIFGELSRATQTAIYFDSYGVLQVKTRKAAWDKDKPASYEFIKESVPGGKPSNIVSLSESTEYEANKVKVNWKPTGFSETRDNIVPFEVVWEPEGDVVLRSTDLAKNLLVGDNVIYLQAKEGKTWPWKGMMNVEGEWISYDAKRYVHHDKDGKRRVTWVEDYEQQKNLDLDAGPFHRHLNTYTGALRIEERGLWGTEEVNHRIDLNHWTKMRRMNYSRNVAVKGAIKLNTGRSTVTIVGKKQKKSMNDYTYLFRGNGLDQGSRYIGARMKIDKSAHKDKVGGIFFAADDGLGSGYFLEVMATARMNGKMRNNRNEVLFYSMNQNGSKKVIGGQTIKMKDKSKNNKKKAKIKRDVGARLAVPMNRFIDFDIWFSPGNNRVQIFANGRLLISETIPSGWRHSNVSRMGLYARGHSSVTFDYFYAINSPGVDKIDSESYYDRIDGGFYSTQAADWTFGTRDARRKVKKKRWRKKKKRGKKWWKWKPYTQRFSQRFYEEFGPVAHEVREFNVEFTSETPVLESRLYFSNDTQAVCTEYIGDIKSADFIMANITRAPAIVSGDDERTTQGNGTINHKLFVYGRPVIQKDAQEIIKEDEWAIRRRGTIEVEYDSPWIQNKEAANDFANWLTEHWSRSDSTLEVEVFGNPLIELTDVVHVKYDHIDDYFYVTAVSNTYESGLTTTLSLRKVSQAVVEQP